jgi:pilus assembly protein CpaE
MSIEVQAIVAVDDEVDRGLIETLVAGGPAVTVLDYLELGTATASAYGSGDVLVVACMDFRSEVGEYIAEAARQHPDRPVVVLCPNDGNGYIGYAFGAGADDVVPLPVDADHGAHDAVRRQLAFTLQKAVIRKRGEPSTDRVAGGRMICVLGLKGGCGKTLTVANLGVSLARAGRTVAMVDLDLQFGDLGLAMGVKPERTIYDLVRSGGSLDAEKLSDYLVAHPSGARVLLAPVSPDQAGEITVPFLREVERLLREMHEYVLIDTPPNFTPAVISATDVSSDVLLVAMRDTLSLKNTKLGLETLERMEYDRRRIRLVLNRANTNVGIEREDVLAILGRDADVYVPSHRAVAQSINRGAPIAAQGGNAAGRAFRSLADMYLGDDEQGRAPEPVKVPRRARRRLFARNGRGEVTHGAA